MLGGATSKVGDPMGKDEFWKLLTDDNIQHNIRGIGLVFNKFLTFEETSNPRNTDAVMANNNDWFSTINYPDC